MNQKISVENTEEMIDATAKLLGISSLTDGDTMLRVGFKSIRSRTIDTSMMPMDLDIARK